MAGYLLIITFAKEWWKASFYQERTSYERMMKSFVLSRKNFLFCFSENGADKSSIAYSIVETARANNLRTEDYLNYVFTKLGEVENPTEEDYKNLLPYSKSLPDYLKNNNE